MYVHKYMYIYILNKIIFLHILVSLFSPLAKYNIWTCARILFSCVCSCNTGYGKL